MIPHLNAYDWSIITLISLIFLFAIFLIVYALYKYDPYRSKEAQEEYWKKFKTNIEKDNRRIKKC